MPNFLIIGAAKSGTSSLYAYLKQHPQIYLCPIKETNFFAFEGEEINFPGLRQNESTKSYQAGFKTDLESYQQQFKPKASEIAIGEVCPSYLYIPKAAERIKYYIPNAKIIIILRDPIQRAYSNFLHHIRDRVECYDNFTEALEAEKWRIKKSWWWGFHYLNVSLYFEQVKRYFDLFDSNNIRVYLYEDFKTNSLYILKNIFQFLEVDGTFIPNIVTKYNTNAMPKNKILDTLIKESSLIKTIYQSLISQQLRNKINSKITNLNTSIKPQLSAELQQELIPLFREDIFKLQELIQQDLSEWLR